jgi:hypothetical protein
MPTAEEHRGVGGVNLTSGSVTSRRTRQLRVLLALLASGGLVGGCGGSATDSGTSNLSGSNLSNLLLRPAQVGPGYHSGPQQRTLAGQPSGALCAESLRSEPLRTARLHAVFNNPHYPAAERVGIIDEVIAYRSGGAQQAMREVRHAVTTCPSYYHLSPITDSDLLSGYLALRNAAYETRYGETSVRTSIWIYQVRNDVLSSLCVLNPKGRDNARLLPVALHAAEESARNLG